MTTTTKAKKGRRKRPNRLSAYRRATGRNLIETIEKSGVLDRDALWLRNTWERVRLFIIGREGSPIPTNRLSNGRRLPRWDELNHWTKLQLAVLKMSFTRCLTVEVKLHPSKARLWIGDGRDIRTTIRRNLRDQLKNTAYARLPYVLVIEGHDKSGELPTLVHLHGIVEATTTAEEDAFREALRKAVGYLDQSEAANDNAVSSQPFYGRGTRFGNYITKNMHRPDSRLLKRRLIFSQAATQDVRSFYDDVVDALAAGTTLSVPVAANDNEATELSRAA